jgi:hypothetical protein
MLRLVPPLQASEMIQMAHDGLPNDVVVDESEAQRPNPRK